MAPRAVAVLAALAVLAFAAPARADAIDGAWCLASTGRMVIDGPAIQTPGGARITGDYSRHAFRYIVPAGEPGAGSEVHMILLGEEAVQVQVGAGPARTWHRCGPDVS
ncbi:MAG: hypothetical protein BGP12_21660 [Rhodospirillales bacterium 70-18]|mgnify:CR=1 FL=1|nr:hypothetical protein [Rhodospirillales bacterium]OJY70355.1 MAG: hypothetical protein BGP12_21660 [Rhodospirillales bacterium 70-18]